MVNPERHDEVLFETRNFDAVMLVGTKRRAFDMDSTVTKKSGRVIVEAGWRRQKYTNVSTGCMLILPATAKRHNIR
eukprot:3188043-Lingulodinium_polyedra.AAC.1